MKVGQFSRSSFYRELRGAGVVLDLGVAAFHLKTSLNHVAETVHQLYSDYSLLNKSDWFDFSISIRQPFGLRSYYRPQVNFVWDGYKPFLPLPLSQAYPLLEWGMNWCVANHMHQNLLLHAAVLERNGKAIVFPAPPGSGKSTLTAFLAHTGWRLLSDEMAVIDLKSGEVIPFVRPICLKNDSIDLVKGWFPDAVVSQPARNTQKGDVAHVKPPAKSIEQAHYVAPIAAFVLPTFAASTALKMEELTNTDAVLMLVENAFNHDVLGQDGFSILTQLVENSLVCTATYSDLNELQDVLNEIVE